MADAKPSDELDAALVEQACIALFSGAEYWALVPAYRQAGWRKIVSKSLLYPDRASTNV